MSEENISLKVENVTKRYGDFKAVDDISFDVRAGRIFGFLGPNGAGKTTTIRMIVNITAPDEGRIELFGNKMSPQMQDRIGYLPEERGLYKKMKINDQLRYFAALKDVPQKKADERIDYWLKRFELSKWKTKKAADLSKGMQQKIQFIAAVLHEPELIILDEPFSGLDPINVELLIDIVAELKSKGKTIIFSTHQMETAERLCDDIILINKARKVLGGSLRRVKESFGKDRVALRSSAGNDVLENSGMIAKITEHSDEKELLLNKNADAQQLLRTIIAAGADVTKFEIVEPSLNDIFIEAVNASEN
jgi:ABC-2 type transport system ATP-binding protein